MDNNNMQFHMELQPGTPLNGGKYIIESKIGSGGFGITYKAIHRILNRPMCIKEYFISGRCSRYPQTNMVALQNMTPELYEKYRQSFVHEAQMIASLRHANIVEVTDIFDENNTAYMVMPFIEGRTLEDIVEKEGSLQYASAINYIAQITNAIDFIHKHHILHRDIKPGNIMITPDHMAILIDFGSAREFEQDRTMAHTSIFTRGYAPPEQYNPNTHKGSYTDIYALGATLYFILTGVEPIDSALRTIEELKEPKELNPNISSDVNRTIMKAMELKPDKRHQTIQEFMDDMLNVKPSGVKPVVSEPEPQKVTISSGSEVLYDVVVKSSGTQKLALVKMVTDLTGWGLKESKEFVDVLPQTIKEGVGEKEAYSLKKCLTEIGATVELLRRTSGGVSVGYSKVETFDPVKETEKGDDYYYGRNGVSQDYAKAVEHYRKAAEYGYAEAQYYLGYSYKNGEGVAQNYAEAVKWYRKSAEQGYCKAQDRLGECYYYGEGVGQDYYEAVKWYRKSADQGYARGQISLGICYENGQGVDQDCAEAVKWYRKAADQGEKYAQCNLAYCYENGQGVDQNYTEAVKWYRKAAEQGHVYAQNSLGLCYEKGQGVAQDYAESVKWYRKSAEQGEMCAQCNLGWCYENGQGVSQDYAEAVKWYRKSAEQGYARGQKCLGLCYEKGQGVAQNYAESVKWYRKAAEQGDFEAQRLYGACYYDGRGVSRDYSEAVRWFRKSADQGDAESQYFMGACYLCGTGVEKDYDKTMEWFMKAAENDYVAAFDGIGVCYELGYGIEQDYEEAAAFYRIAADKGDEDAKKHLSDIQQKIREIEEEKKRKEEEEKRKKCYGTINGHEYVDLGLPSGLKWAKCNMGARMPIVFGDFYAWGELETKRVYSENNYKYSYIEHEGGFLGIGGQDVVKYTSLGDISGTKYDVARHKWGGSWRIPKKSEWEELIKYCKWEWSGLGGNSYRVTGPNGNSIVIPVTGSCVNDKWYGSNSFGYYAASTPSATNVRHCYEMYFWEDKELMVKIDGRFGGRCVRPVSY